MIDETLETQAALYAIDALPAAEAETFRLRLADTPGLAALVQEYEAAASQLAVGTPALTPPPQLRRDILRAIAPRPPIVESSRTSWLPWVLAAGFAFAAGALWVQNDRLRVLNRGQMTEWSSLNHELQTAKSDLEEKDRSLAAGEDELAKLREREAVAVGETTRLKETIADLEKRRALAEMQVATLTSKLDGSYLASIAWDKSAQEGVLQVRRLPETQVGKDYQLWVIDPKVGAPVSAGVFKVQPDGSATIHFAPAQKISEATTFAVSVEKSGGSASPEGPIVLSN